MTIADTFLAHFNYKKTVWFCCNEGLSEKLWNIAQQLRENLSKLSEDDKNIPEKVLPYINQAVQDAHKLRDETPQLKYVVNGREYDQEKGDYYIRHSEIVTTRIGYGPASFERSVLKGLIAVQLQSDTEEVRKAIENASWKRCRVTDTSEWRSKSYTYTRTNSGGGGQNWAVHDSAAAATHFLMTYH